MRTDAVILAAGRSTRYRASGGTAPSKLVDLFAGEPMLRHVVRAALASRAGAVVVVTGHAREAVEASAAGAAVRFAHNPDYASGLASSLRVGLAALGPEPAAAMVLLGDMPLVDAATIDALIDAAVTDPAADAMIPVHRGLRGNPVLLTRRLFAAASRLAGDEGARRLLRDPSVRVREIAFADDAVRRDVDERPIR